MPLKAKLTHALEIIKKESALFTAIAAIFAIIGAISGTYIFVNSAPIINQFDGIPTAIFKDDSARLVWDVFEADSVNIDNVGNNLPIHFSKDISPKESTKYSLIATKWGLLKSTATKEIRVWDPQVNITNPKNGMSVNASATISGTFSGDLPEDYYIWIVVRSARAEGDEWWTQGDASLDRSPNWSVPGAFGGEQDVGENFIIKAILVDKTLDYILNKHGKYGVHLPPTIKNLDTVVVKRLPSEISAKISYPLDGIPIPTNEIIASGTITREIPENQSLWLLVGKKAEDQWWPQGGGKIIPINKSWEKNARVGEPEDLGLREQMIVILVDEQVNQYLENWVNDTNIKEDWYSIPLPKCNVLAEINVVRSNG